MSHSAFDVEVTVHEGIWTAACDDLGLATEADSYPALVARSWEIAPELAELNAVGIPAEQLRLRFVHDTRARHAA